MGPLNLLGTIVIAVMMVIYLIPVVGGISTLALGWCKIRGYSHRWWMKIYAPLCRVGYDRRSKKYYPLRKRDGDYSYWLHRADESDRQVSTFVHFLLVPMLYTLVPATILRALWLIGGPLVFSGVVSVAILMVATRIYMTYRIAKKEREAQVIDKVSGRRSSEQSGTFYGTDGQQRI